jgi:outer membrane biosynthesis protein TonB
VTLRGSIRWIALALLGLLIAAAVALAASNLASQQIGIASESVSAGDSLAPPVTSVHRGHKDAPGKEKPSKEAEPPAESEPSTETERPSETEPSAEPSPPAEPELSEPSPAPAEGDDSGGGGGGGRDD